MHWNTGGGTPVFPLQEAQGRAKKRPKKGRGELIIAIDFDGILCEDNFPDIGTPRYDVISLVRQLIDKGNEVVLWTTRNGEELEKAIKWCTDYGLHFCNVNGPAPSNEEEYRDKYPTQSRKIYADVYIDDHNLEYAMDTDRRPWLVSYLRDLRRSS